MAYGAKNKINLDPLSYNLMLMGESGIGKTTIIKEYCEKLAGENGYLFLEIGKEDGADAIEGIVYEPCEDWDKFEEVIDDIIENKTSDYPDLRVVAVDTYDELFRIAEPEVIRMHNSENPDKPAKTIKSAFGGFQAGEDKVVEIVLDKLWSLKTVGVSFIPIGHTKSKNVDDPVTGESYVQLTTNMSQKYFNALKTKVHFLGVAAIDREIVKEKTGKKDIVTKKEILRSVVKDESRKITFRDDNFVIDSKSRFAEIIDEIPMSADELIKAVKDAILKEHSKSNRTLEQSKKEQANEEAQKLKEIAKNEEFNKTKKELDALVDEIMEFIKDNKTNTSLIKPILEKSKSLGYAKPTDISKIKDAKDVLSLIK
jgi:DNA polymerase III delta prime subunit